MKLSRTEFAKDLLRNSVKKAQAAVDGAVSDFILAEVRKDAAENAADRRRVLEAEMDDLVNAAEQHIAELQDLLRSVDQRIQVLKRLEVGAVAEKGGER